MKMILSAIVTLSAVVAFANPGTTTTTAPAAGTTTGTTATTTTTTTTKEAKATTTKGMTKEEAEKACAKETGAAKETCVKKHMGTDKKM